MQTDIFIEKERHGYRYEKNEFCTYRRGYLTRLLAEDGHTAAIFGAEKAETDGVQLLSDLSALENADCVLLPLPLFGNGELNMPLSEKKVTMSDILRRIKPSVPILGGKIPSSTADMAKLHGFTLIDYLEREELAVANAVPTAEGACALAMEELPITLSDAKALVVGFGRCGEILAHRLAALGCDVTVSARKYSDFAWIEAYGYKHIPTSDIASYGGSFDVVFNTVPALVLDETALRSLRRDCLVIDLASKPGGVDLAEAERLNIKAIHALGLPGKTAPVTAGEIIAESIIDTLKKGGGGNV